MRIEIKKRRDARPVLTCVRPDGTRTWAELHPFQPVHDLTHYAVESVLGFDEAFFRLVASGWRITDFEEPHASERMRAQAHWAETIVGLLDRERGTERIHTPTEFEEALAAALEGQSAQPCRALTAGELAAIRALRSRLTAQWLALDAGSTLLVEFPAGKQVG